MATESLRDTLSSVFDDTVKETVADNAVVTGDSVSSEAKPETAPPAQTAESKTDDRPRDGQGRFIEKKGEAPPKAAGSATPPPPATSPAVPAAAPQKPAIQRPSTWKKDYWEAYDKLATENPALAQYILQRESEFAKGVSTYKQEWESAKPLLDAMAPFMPLLEQHKIPAGQWISRLGEAHKQLSLGTPEQKLSMFSRLAQDYGVPIEQMFVRGQDGQIYRNPNLQVQAAPQQAQGIRPEDVQELVKKSLAEQQSQAAIEAFSAQQDKHPHFDEVRDTMAALLQAGLADGLEDAYEAALKHPRHAALYEAMQLQQRQADEQRQAEERKKAAETARRKAVSPRSATPTSVANGGDGKKGLRSAIEGAFDEHVGGRV